MELPRGVFVTGTDTEVGKTWVSAAICRTLREEGVAVRACKPVLSGTEEPGPADHEVLAEATRQDPEVVSPVRFAPAVSPELAARRAGTPLDPEALVAAVFTAAAGGEAVVVEGVGGFLVPLADGVDVRSLAAALRLPVVVVARPGLGTINHTLLTVAAVRAALLPLAAVVISDWPDEPGDLEQDNRETIERLAGCPVHVLGHGARSLAAAGALLGAAHPTLRHGDLAVRTLRPGDGAPLRRIRSAPEVARWWRSPGANYPWGPWEDEVPLVVEHEGRPVGAIQWWAVEDPSGDEAGIDVFLDPAVHGRGIGRRAVGLLADHLHGRGFRRVTIDPAAANEAAVRAYRAAGFVPFGTARQAQRLPDGTLCDTLFMERHAPGD